MAALYRAPRRHAEAEPLYLRALAILEKALGPEHPSVTQTVGNYAALLRETGRGAEANPTAVRAMVKRAQESQ